ncbi:restriction endonuclease subunit S [Lactiplantibacillus argentoratensis]|uniref:restriction endonuclease subunit S n=1 Tax=Lactiplantibacillus argentoratensis TaxID=271881 RepID=UPI003EC00898
MNAKQAKYPQLRFKGFTDPWEQRKLNNYLDVSKEKNKNNYYSKDEVLSVSGKVGIVNQIAFQGRSFAGASVAPYRVVHNGDVVYTKSPLSRNPFGIIKTNKGKTGIVSTLYAVYKPISNLTNTEFVQSYFELGLRMNKYMKPLVNIGAKHDMKVSDANALLGEVVFPSFEEQSKITKFLGQLDDLITLHQRKLAKLKKLKQGYLQKMFPKNGSKFPQLRFSGFADAWEQRKLGDIAEFNPKAALPERFEYVDLESVVGTDLIFHRTENKGDAPSRAQRLAQPGDVFYQTVRPYQKNNYLYDLPYDNYVFSTGYAQMRPNINGYFLLSRLQEEGFVNTVLGRSTGTSYPAINANDLAEIEIRIPKSREEQDLIGKLFFNLDHLITLHQRKLKHLQLQKKGLLQQMFC